MDEITIQIDHNETTIHGEYCEWYSAFVVLNDDYISDCLWYGCYFETYEQAEQAARDYLRDLVEVQP